MQARQQQNLRSRKAKISASKMEKRDNPEAENSLQYLREKKQLYNDKTVIVSILSIFTVVCIFVIF